MSSFQFEQIGVIRSPYKEKFAVPRQPGLVKSANGELHLIAPYNQADAVVWQSKSSVTNTSYSPICNGWANLYPLSRLL